MNSLQQWKQLELYRNISTTHVRRDTGSEEFIAKHLSESPIPPWRDSWSQSLSGAT